MRRICSFADFYCLVGFLCACRALGLSRINSCWRLSSAVKAQIQSVVNPIPSSNTKLNPWKDKNPSHRRYPWTFWARADWAEGEGAQQCGTVFQTDNQTTKQLNNQTTRQQNNQTPTTKHQQPIIIYFYLLIFYFSTKQPNKKIHFAEKRKTLSEPLKSFGWLLYHPSGRKCLESPWNGEIRLFSLICQSVHFKICECKGVRYLDNNRQSACGEGQCFHTLPSIPPSPS